jgi:sulfur-carrier protein
VAILRLREPLKRLAGGEAEREVAAGTVGDMLRGLEAANPDLRGWILDERGAVRRHINVYVNGEPAEDDSPLGPDDRVEVLPAISGG